MMPGAQPRKLADECKEYVSAEEVRDILAFLVKTGFLKKNGDKVYTQTEKSVTGSPEALPIAIRSMHKEMGNMAVRAVDRYSASERYFTGMTIGVNETNYSRIVAEIDSCARKIAAIANETENLNQVYGLNFQLFPFTNKIEGGSHA